MLTFHRLRHMKNLIIVNASYMGEKIVFNTNIIYNNV